jgi:hypothetical protein
MTATTGSVVHRTASILGAGGMTVAAIWQPMLLAVAVASTVVLLAAVVGVVTGCVVTKTSSPEGGRSASREDAHRAASSLNKDEAAFGRALLV